MTCWLADVDDDKENAMDATTTKEKAELAIDLMRRASGEITRVADMMAPMPFGPENTLARSMDFLNAITELVDEHAPDADWWRDYFILTGQHMVLTDEGWCPPFQQDPEFPVEILDELNAPAKSR